MGAGFSADTGTDSRAGELIGSRALQRSNQLRRADRLADIVVHARRETQLAVALHGVGGHGNDPRSLFGRPVLVDTARGLQAVELGHLHIHQHNIVVLAGQRVEHLQTVASHIRAVAQPPERQERHL